MAKQPMKVVPDGLYPPEVKTPEERMEFLGRKLLSKPSELHTAPITAKEDCAESASLEEE
jgi:hypothetical protein